MVLIPGFSAGCSAFADIGAVLLALEVDEVDRLVSAFASLVERIAERYDVQHAAAGGNQFVIDVARSARMEHRDAFQRAA